MPVSKCSPNWHLSYILTLNMQSDIITMSLDLRHPIIKYILIRISSC